MLLSYCWDPRRPQEHVSIFTLLKVALDECDLSFAPRLSLECYYVKEEALGNAEAIARHSGSIPVFELPPLPPREASLEPWYVSSSEDFNVILDALRERHSEGLRGVMRMKERGRNVLWWPFTQHDDLTADDITVLDSAYGDYFCTAEVDDTIEAKVSDERVGSHGVVQHFGSVLILGWCCRDISHWDG